MWLDSVSVTEPEAEAKSPMESSTLVTLWGIKRNFTDIKEIIFLLNT